MSLVAVLSIETPAKGVLGAATLARGVGALVLPWLLAFSPAVQASDMEEPVVLNGVLYFEIPATDLDRAIQFYQQLFAITLTRRSVDGYELAFFPRSEGQVGATGALAQGDVYKPSREGAVIYFDVDNIDLVLRRVTTLGAKVLYEKTDIGEAGFVAEFEDSEGNRIALTQAR